MRSAEFKVLENVENGHLENTYNNGATGDDPATLEELSSELQKLGLSDLEVKVYLTLLTYGTLTAVQAADRSAIPRSRAYDALASLERKGLVARPPVKPTKYGVLPPQESLRGLVDSISEEYSKRVDELSRASDEWRTVEREKAAALARALADPVRRAVLQLLDHGPIRQFELAQTVSQALGKRYGDSLLRYHLRPLERAGLIGFEADPKNPRAKLVYRKADFRIQVLPREKPVLRIREPRTTEEFVAELRAALKKEGE